MDTVWLSATMANNFAFSPVPRWRSTTLLRKPAVKPRKKGENMLGLIQNKMNSEEPGVMESARASPYQPNQNDHLKTKEKYDMNWSNIKKLPEKFVFPPDQTPGEYDSSPLRNVPVIDMATDHATLVQQIMEASQDLGGFQVINHGVPRKVMDEAREVFKEFFALPEEDKQRLRPGNGDPRCVLSPSSLYYDTEPLHLWREALKQKCTPWDACLPLWPHKPSRYREVVREFVTQINEVGLRILELMCEGLGLEAGYFAGDLTRELDLNLNQYPPSPDPSLTLGAPRHSDRSVLTIFVQEDVPGLQIYDKDGQWVGVEPIPDALAFAVGYILHMVSNGKLRNGDHRVLTSKSRTRTSGALFLHPTKDCLVEPARALIDKNRPPIYRGVPYHEFLQSYITRRVSKDFDEILEPFRIPLS